MPGNLNLLSLSILYIFVYKIHKHIYRQCLTNGEWFHNHFSALRWWKTVHIQYALQILNFDLFSVRWHAMWYFLLMLGSGSKSELPISPMIRSVNNQIDSQPFCNQTTTMFFASSALFKKLYEIFNVLLQNRLGVRWFCPTLG